MFTVSIRFLNKNIVLVLVNHNSNTCYPSTTYLLEMLYRSTFGATVRAIKC